MKKSVSRVFSMLLALVMLLGMSAVAATEKITFDLNAYNGLKLDGVLSMGYDEDGCEQYSFENSMLGKWLLQSDGTDLVFGGDQLGYYTISAEELSQALNNILNSLSAGGMSETDIALSAYYNSAAFEADQEVLTALLMGEINRVASIAQELGLVTIYENGDLQIYVDRDNLLSMVSTYLNRLSVDEEVLSSFLGLEIFKIQGIGMNLSKDQIVSEIQALAAQIEEARNAEEKNLDGYLKICLFAETGTATGEYYMAELDYGVPAEETRMTFTYDGANLMMDLQKKATDTVTVMKVNDGEYDVTYNTNEETLDLSCEIGANGLAAKLAIAGDYVNGEGSIVIDQNGIDGKWDFKGDREYANGLLKYNPASGAISFKSDASSGYETLKAEIAYDPANEEFAFGLYADVGYETLKVEIEYMDEDLYATLTKTRGSRTTADIVVTGSSTYRIKGNWMYDYTNYTINATMRMKNSGFQIEGELGIGQSVVEFNYTKDNANNAEALVVNVKGADPSDKIAAEAYHTAAETTETVKVVVESNMNSDTMKLGYAAEMNKATGEVKGEFAVDKDGSAISGTFFFSNAFIEIKFTDGEVNYRLYSEDMSGENNLSVKSGFTAEEIANPGEIMDIVLFMANAAFENGLTFDANLNTMLGVFASVVFDGNIIKLDVSMNGETISMEGKKVSNENGEYLLFTGIVSGMPFEAKIGMKMEDESTLCLFVNAAVNGETAFDAEAHIIQTGNGYAVEVFGDSIVIDGGEKITLKIGAAMETEETLLLYGEITGEVPEHLMAAYLPITVVEGENASFIKAVLSIVVGEDTQEIGNAYVGYDVLSENAQHVTGERLTADMLTEMALEFINSLSAY